MSKQVGKINFKSILNISLRLIIVCTIIAAVVAGVNLLTKDRIAENDENAVTETIREVFVNGDIQKVDFNSEGKAVESVRRIVEPSDNSILGFSVICAPKGFGGEIKMMVAFDADKSIKAVRIMSHSETPGIGDKVKNDAAFASQFVGKSETLSYGVDGVDKISGSSKSSKAVLNGVNDAIAVIKTIG